MSLRRITMLVLALLLVMSPFCLAGENIQFVDANGATGYYVDVNTISYETETEGEHSSEVVSARVLVVKARQNRRFIYDIRFNREKSTYQTLSSVVQTYDTKEVVESHSGMAPPAPYSLTSPMHTIVDFIYEQPRKQ